MSDPSRWPALRVAGTRVLWWLAVASLLAGVAFGAVQAVRFLPVAAAPARSDFALYYRDARVGIESGWARMYDNSARARATAEVRPITSEPPGLGSLSTPLLTWLAWPFALLPLGPAYAAWSALVLGCLLFCWWALAPPQSRWLHLGLMALFGPAILTAVLGQATAIAAAAVAACALLDRRGRPLLAGLALGLALVKPQLVFAVPLCLLAGGRWRVAAGFALAGLMLAGVSLAVVGPGGLAVYAGRLLGASGATASLAVDADITPVSMLGGTPARLLAMALVLAAAGLAAARCRGSSSRVLAIGLLGSLLASPYLHYQDALVALLAGWLLLRESSIAERGWLGIGYLQGALATSMLPTLEAAWLLSLAIRPRPGR